MKPARLSQLAVQDIAAARDCFESKERDARRANLKKFRYSVWFRIKPDPYGTWHLVSTAPSGWL